MSTQRVEFVVPVPEELRGVVMGALPPEWREEVEILRLRDGMVIKVIGSGQRRHTLEVRWLSLGAPGILRGPRLAYAYRTEEKTGENEELARYLPALKALCAREDELLSFVSRQMEMEGSPVLGSRLFSETQLLDAVGPKVEGGGVGVAVREFLAARLGEQVVGAVDLYLENPCQQSCVFCVIPRMRALEGHQRRQENLQTLSEHGQDIFSRGIFSELVADLASREPAPALRINGNDWARHPHVDAMLHTLADARDVPIRFIGPSTMLADAEFAARVAQLPGLDGVTLTLQSVDNARHDAMVGQSGSAALAKAALENLRRSGVRVWVNIVMIPDALSEVPSLLRWFRDKNVDCALHAFFPDAHPDGWAPNLLPKAASIRGMLEGLAAELVDVISVLVGFPTCAVPPVLRQRLEPLWHTDEREPIYFAEGCGDCFLRAECSGLAQSYAQHGDDSGLLPEKGVYG